MKSLTNHLLPVIGPFGRNHWHRWLLVGMLLILPACTRTAVPIEYEMSTPSPTEASTIEPAATSDILNPAAGEYAVVWVEQGEVLPVRVSAGIAAVVEAELPHDQRSIELTGTTTALGSSSWVEIRPPSGEVGWVPSWNLTQQVESEAFCGDEAVERLLQSLTQSLRQQDGPSLVSAVSPKRGLIIRHDMSNPEVRLPEEEVRDLFEDRTQYRWGTRFASQTAIQGSFREVIRPSLLDVLDGEPIRACNRLQFGDNAPLVEWPGLYENLNYISLYRPAEADGNSFDWRTWVIAVEYIDGEPFIALMIQIRPQV